MIYLIVPVSAFKLRARFFMKSLMFFLDSSPSSKPLFAYFTKVILSVPFIWVFIIICRRKEVPYFTDPCSEDIPPRCEFIPDWSSFLNFWFGSTMLLGANEWSPSSPCTNGIPFLACNLGLLVGLELSSDLRFLKLSWGRFCLFD